MPRLTYTVTQEHIDRKLHGCTTCPHALAAQPAIREIGWAEGLFRGASLHLIETGMDYPAAVVQYPSDVYDWINRYDGYGGEPVEPATFSFDIPEPPR